MAKQFAGRTMAKERATSMLDVIRNPTPRELRQKYLPFVIWCVLILLTGTSMMSPAVAIAVMEFCLLVGIYTVVEQRATKEIIYYTKFVVLYGVYSTFLNLVEAVFKHVLNPESVTRFIAAFKILLTLVIYHTGSLDVIYSGILKGGFS